MADQPKKLEVIARGLCRIGSRILLCQDVSKGYYYLPGGHVEPGESAAEACAREFREETGLDVKVGTCRLAAEVRFRQSGKPRHELNLMFHVEHPDEADPPAPIESLEPDIRFEWVELAALPSIDLRPRVLLAWLASGGATEAAQMCAWLSVDESAEVPG